MYTGVVEATGEIRAIEERTRGRRLRAEIDTSGIDPGDSVGINGACLTADSVGDGWFEADLSPETVERTYLADLAPGDAVNVERPLAVGDRFDGHVVEGTVDAVAEVVGIEDHGNGWWFTFSIPAGYERYVVEKGAVALDGISLTAAEVTEDALGVAVVPATYEATTLSEKSVGDPVHFEADLLSKYVERHREHGDRRVA